MNAIRLASTVGMSRAEWLAIRRQGIGGSDLGAILGVSPFTTPAEVWADKMGLVEPRDTAPMRWGRLMEDVIAREFSESLRRRVVRVRSVLQSREDPLMLANPDRLVLGPPELLEIKTAGLRGAAYWQQDEPPAHAVLQVQHYLRVQGLDVGHLVCLVGGQDMRIWVVAYDEGLITAAWDRARDWWQRYVATGTMPEPTGRDTDLLKRVYRVAEPGRQVELPGSAQEWIERYQRAKAREREAAQEAEEAANRLRAMLGPAEEGTIYGEVAVTWRAVERRDLDTKRLREELPDVAARYERVSRVRRFVVKEEE